MKLKTKFTLILCSLIIIGISVTALFAFSHYEKSIRETIATQQFLMISALSDEIDNKLQTARQQLLALARAVPQDIMQSPAKAQQFLDSKPCSNPMFDNHLFIFNTSGRIFVESPYAPGRRGFDLSFRDYIKKTVQTNRPYISDPYTSSQPHKHPVIMLTAPLFNSKGGMIGILAGSIDLMRDNFLGRMSTVRIGKTGYLYLSATDRTLIMHVDRKRILTKLEPGLNSLYDKAVEGFEGTGDTTNSYGIKMVSSFKRLKAKNWILGANYPQDEAYAEILKAKQYFLTITVMAVVAIFFIISWITGALINPLELFTLHVKDIPQKTGDDRFIAINTGDEIGTLASAFNNMVAEIDRDIAERKLTTAELEKLNRALNTSNEQLRELTAHLQSVREEERTNIAREIHDELGQALTALKIDLSWLLDNYGDHRPMAGKAQSMLDALNATITSVKRICTELRPSLLDDFGLVAAMEWQANEFQKRTGIECVVTAEPEDMDMDKKRSIVLFRIFQEALTNTFKHARATKVTAKLIQGDNGIILEIIDNGKGIENEQLSKPQSFGIMGMRERVSPWGGVVEITGDKNYGTTVKVTMPHAD